MKLQNELLESIKQSQSTELSAEIVEFSIDKLLDEGILKEIPWVGWVFKAKSAYSTISDRLFLAKVMSFLISIDKVSEDEKLKYSGKIDNDPAFKNKLGGTLLLVLEKINDLEKPAMLAKVFSAFIKSYISFDDFHILSDAINTAYVGDLKKLANHGLEAEYYNKLELERLYRSNLSEIQKSVDVPMQAGGSHIDINFMLSRYGGLLKDILQDKIRERVEEIEHNKKVWEEFF